MIEKIQSWLQVRENQIVVAILALASFLRLYRISDYMTFLGDEGRDVLTVKHILEGDLTLLGPRSSAADFFYGPIYYYLITPFLWLFRYDPVGPAVFIALIGIATVYLVYRVGKIWFGKTGALFAAALFAVSPVVLTYSRSSWNPNPLPFVSLLSLFLLYQGIKKSNWKYFLVIGVLLGIGLQLQYLALFLGIIVAAITLIGTILEVKKRRILELIKRYILVFTGFLIGWSPFLVFEALHQFPNTKTIINFLLGKYGDTAPTTTTFIGQSETAFFRLFGRLVTRFPQMHLNQASEHLDIFIWLIATTILAIIAVVAVLRVKDRLARVILLCWVIGGVLLFGFYKKDIYDYYLGFMFPLPFLLLGNLIRLGFEEKRQFIFKSLAGVLFIVLFVINLLGMPFLNHPNRQKDQVKTIAEFVVKQTDNQPFNFALITPGNSDHAYRYYLEVLGHKPVAMENTIVDPERKTVTDQLLVVCEDVTCSPLGHPLFEVAAFGRAEIVGEWNVSVVKIFKLAHYKEE